MKASTGADNLKQLHVGLDDGVHDAVVGAATAQVAAHPLAQLVPAARDRGRREVGGDVAGHAAPQFRDHADGRADLAGRAVAALEAIMLDEGLLQRVRRALGAETLDGGDGTALKLHRKREAGQERWPSTSTVQAPQAPWSQPFLVPDGCSLSRSRSSKETRGSSGRSTSVPFTAIVIASSRPALGDRRRTATA